MMRNKQAQPGNIIVTKYTIVDHYGDGKKHEVCVYDSGKYYSREFYERMRYTPFA